MVKLILILLDYSASTPTKKIYGILTDWLQVSERSLKMIFLTGSRIGPITDFSQPATGRNPYPHLDDNDGLINYLAQNYIDIAILRGEHGSNDRCLMIDGLYSRQLNRNGRLSPYLTVPKEMPNMSINKCGEFKEAFHHLSYHLGQMSPGSQNIQG